MKAIWKRKTIAESNETIVVENNHYFPRESIKEEFFNQSDTVSSCYWKGKANYLNVVVEDQINKDAAWYYQHPLEKAKYIAGYVAFWNGVQVVDE